MKSKRSREELLSLLDIIMHPEAYDFTEADGERVLLEFCAGCPDPVGAGWLVIDCLDPMSDEELVDRALAMSPRKLADVPASELPANHPIRLMTD